MHYVRFIPVLIILINGIVGCQKTFDLEPFHPTSNNPSPMPIPTQNPATPTPTLTILIYTPTPTATSSVPTPTNTPSFTTIKLIPSLTWTPSMTFTPTIVVPTPTPFPYGQVVTGTDADLDQIIANTTIPIMVEFWAVWCPECVPYRLTVTKFAKDFAGQVLVIQVDVDKNPGSIAEYNVSYIPYTLFFNNGSLRYIIPGSTTEATLANILFNI